MSINFDEYVAMPGVTWEDVYQVFKARLIEERGAGICPECGMHDKGHTIDCPVAGFAVVHGLECTACGHLFHKGPCPEPSK